MDSQILRTWNQYTYSEADLEEIAAYLQEPNPLPSSWQALSETAQEKLGQQWAMARLDRRGRIMIGSRVLVSREKAERVLTAYYNDASKTGNRDVLYQRVAKDHVGISRRRVWKFLQTQQTHQILRARNVHPQIVQPLLALHPFETWGIDLINMQSYSSDNDFFGYILLIVDHMTKHVFLRPIARKNARETVRALTDIFKYSPQLPKIINSDNGREFDAQIVKTFLARHHIRQVFIHAYQPKSNAIAERNVRKTKTRLFAILRQQQTRRWLEQLPHVQANINSSRSRSTGYTPDQVRDAAVARTPDDEAILANAASRLKRLAIQRLDKAQTKARRMETIHVGDTVRVSYESIKTERKSVMRKSYLGEWSESRFVVTHISPGSAINMPHYRLRESGNDGEPIHQRFYRRDLQRIDPDTLQVPPNVERPYQPPPSLLTERRTLPQPRKIRIPERFRRR